MRLHRELNANKNNSPVRFIFVQISAEDCALDVLKMINVLN